MRIATRSSKLALKQVDIFKDLYKNQEINFEIKTQITEGDRKSKKGENLFDKAHFVEDLESSLLNNEADIAIHSLKFAFLLRGVIVVVQAKHCEKTTK